jgi:hypothetical protein
MTVQIAEYALLRLLGRESAALSLCARIGGDLGLARLSGGEVLVSVRITAAVAAMLTCTG